MTPFHWVEDSTLKIDVSTTSATGALLKVPTGQTQIRVFNGATVPVFVKKGTDSTVTATTSALPLAPGGVEVFTFTNPAAAPVTHVAAITASGSGSIYITVGTGL